MLRFAGAAAPIAFLSLMAGSPGARAQAQAAVDLPDVVVTADRQAEPISKTGSAITVLTREQIQQRNPGSVADALRDVPGLDVTENGGPGATSGVRIRGANTGQTLVLVDGIRVNDPAAASGDFDFAGLLPTAIERIEVLRGPQSALYGSDAIGGVVNIITRQGGGEPHGELRTELGSYGTMSQSGSAYGSVGPWSYSIAGGGEKSAGFSRFGYRIGQLERKFGTNFEADGYSRYGGYGRFAYDAGEGVKLEFGALSFRTYTQYDASSSTLPSKIVATGASRVYPDTPSESTRLLTTIFGRGTADQGPLRQTLTVYLTETDRTNTDVSFSKGTLPQNTTRAYSEFYGDRMGTEYQGDLRVGDYGTLTFGGRFELEKAKTFSAQDLPTVVPRSLSLEASQATKSVFIQYQLPVGERLVLTAGGRHDEVSNLEFDTWRATAAYLIPETDTKLRASGGTGGKAPTLYQLYAANYGNSSLQPETSIGWDAGVDQKLFDGRASASITYFDNKINNMINFDSTRGSYGGYVNTARAATSGVELETAVVLWPDYVKLTGVATWLRAKDLDTGYTLQRRAPYTGRVGLQITPIPGWLIEPSVTFVGKRWSGNTDTLRLAPYGRLDVYSEYKIDAHWKVFARGENLTDARYQEVLNYGTTGRAGYAGFSVTW